MYHCKVNNSCFNTVEHCLQSTNIVVKYTKHAVMDKSSIAFDTKWYSGNCI